MSLPLAPLCLPGEAHFWICTEVRVDGQGYTHMECQKCKAIKDIPRTMDWANPRKWKVTRGPPAG